METINITNLGINELLRLQKQVKEELERRKMIETVNVWSKELPDIKPEKKEIREYYY